MYRSTMGKQSDTRRLLEVLPASPRHHAHQSIMGKQSEHRRVQGVLPRAHHIIEQIEYWP